MVSDVSELRRHKARVTTAKRLRMRDILSWLCTDVMTTSESLGPRKCTAVVPVHEAVAKVVKELRGVNWKKTLLI